MNVARNISFVERRKKLDMAEAFPKLKITVLSPVVGQSRDQAVNRDRDAVGMLLNVTRTLIVRHSLAP